MTAPTPTIQEKLDEFTGVVQSQIEDHFEDYDYPSLSGPAKASVLVAAEITEVATALLEDFTQEVIGSDEQEPEVIDGKVNMLKEPRLILNPIRNRLRIEQRNKADRLLKGEEKA